MENKSKVSPLTVDGHWFVHFRAGIDADSPKIEGSHIVEITGTCDSDEFLTLLSNKVFDSLSKEAKDLIEMQHSNVFIFSGCYKVLQRLE